jgi:hypothetical protein
MELVKITQVRPNENNPRFIKDYKFKKLVTSIKEFPEMLKLRPIVVNSDMVVLGGNMRLKACKEAGLKEVWILKAEELTEAQQREFIVKDNVGFGEWDWDLLANEWDSVQLEDWGMEVWQGGEDVSNTNDYSNLDVDSKLDKFLDAKIKNLTIPFESQEFDEVILKLEVYLEKYNLVDYKEMVYKIIEDEKL